jgi:hypothetical protein
VGFAEKWYKVMFTKAEEIYIFDDDHLVIIFVNE